MTFLDEKDCKILNILQENCRISLTEIAKQVGLSVDSVKKRITKLEKNGIFYPKIQLRPRMLGFSNIVDVKIKLNNHSPKKLTEFIEYLIKNERVAEVFTVGGEQDLSIVIISKDLKDYEGVTGKVKQKFGDIISSWNETTTKVAYKFERYDTLALLGHKKAEVI
jgi:DNA-binding Lrp family transcriptional regulator